MFQIHLKRTEEETFSFLKSETYASMICAELHLDTYGVLNCICRMCNEIVEFNYLIEHLKKHFLNIPYNCHKCSDSFDDIVQFMNHICNAPNETERDTLQIVSISSILNSKEIMVPDEPLSNDNYKYKLESSCVDEKKDVDVTSPSSLIVADNDIIEKQMALIENSSQLLVPTIKLAVDEILPVEQTLLESRAQTLPITVQTSSRSLLSDHQQEKLLAQNKIKPKPEKEICEFCGIMFRSKAVDSHRLQHTSNIRKYECDICKKSFHHRDGIRHHMRTHRSERPFGCSYCGSKFRTQSMVNKHERIHKERKHACPICPKKFVDPIGLRRHNLVHTGEKPYECDICGIFFRTTEARKSHRRLHTGEKPYACKHCGKAFPQLAGLFCHLKLHKKHGDIS